MLSVSKAARNLEGVKLHLKSHGRASVEGGSGYVAQILRCTRSREEVQHQWVASSLEAAQQQADDWLEEWGTRVGLRSDKTTSEAAGRRQRLAALTGLPLLPAIPQTKAVPGPEKAWELDDEDPAPSQPIMRKERYPTKAEIKRVMDAVRAGGLIIAEVHIRRDGTITIISEQPNSRAKQSPYEEWKRQEGEKNGQGRQGHGRRPTK